MVMKPQQTPWLQPQQQSQQYYDLRLSFQSRCCLPKRIFGAVFYGTTCDKTMVNTDVQNIKN